MKAKPVLVYLAVLLLALSARGQLQVNGYLSFEYEKGERQSEFPDGTFDKVRAGLFFTGKTAKIFDYDLEVRFKTETQVEIEEAWVGIYPSPAFHLKLGFYLVPFGRYNTSSRPYQTRFIKTPLPQAYLYPASWRDIGIQAEGKSKYLRYAAYLGNGLREGADLQAGQQVKDNNKNKAVGGRIGILLSPSFEVGFSYYRGKYDSASERDLSLQGADVSWETDSFLLLYEYSKADFDNPPGYSRGKAEGHYVLLSLRWEDFSLWGSYQTLDYTDPFHGPGFVEGVDAGSGISFDVSRWAVGLVYFAAANVLIKVEYDFNNEGKINLANDVFFAQVTLHF
jgi:hypothetical protein